MMDFLRGERRILRSDIILIACVLLLTILGLVTLYSASYLFALNQSPERFRNGWAPLKSNLIACVLMIVFCLIFAFVRLVSPSQEPEREWKGLFILVAVLGAVFINLLPFFEFFKKVNHRKSIDAMRWIFIKRGGGDVLATFQPSEVIKVVLPVYLAYIFNKNSGRIKTFVYGTLPPAIITALFCILVLIQNNFSEMVLITLTSLAICFVAGVGKRWIIGALALLSLVFCLLIITGREKDDWRGRGFIRIQTYMSQMGNRVGNRDQEKIITDENYQIENSKNALVSGGFWGKGIGQGTLKIRIPEVHADFVFASFAEETGFLGVLFYFILIGVFACLGYMTAWQSESRFDQLLVFGLVTTIVVQTLMNIAVVAEAIPATGIPLPFVSSGGSSLLLTLFSAFLIIRVSRKNITSGNTRRQYAG